MTFLDEEGNQYRFTWRTIQTWYYRYKNYGITGMDASPRAAAKLDMPFQDVRGMKLQQWQKKQPLALAIVRAQKSHLLKDPSLMAFKENAKQVLDRYQTKTATGG